MRKHLLLFLIALFTTAGMAYAQQGSEKQVTGKIIDTITQEPLIGATVLVKGTSTATTAALDGSFKLKVPSGSNTLVISFIGYIPKEVAINESGKNLGTIQLSPSSSSIKQVTIIGDVAIDRKTPVAVSTISRQYIDEKLGNQDIPELLSTTPGVMATAQGGGYGDSRVSIRGFSSGSKKGNVALTMNGIPQNDIENGQIYWSDFIGLTAVTSSIQIQRGLGASKIIVPSFGGTINITTVGTDAEKGGYIFQGIGSNGWDQTAVLVSTGLDKNGWSATFQGSRTMGNMYADGTMFKGYNYFFNLSKVLTPNQTLSFTILGVSQTHGERGSQSLAAFASAPQGIKWNPDLGVKDGQQFNDYTNIYSSPIFSLSHIWTINEKSSLSTQLYSSYGTGSGGNFATQSDYSLPRIGNMYSPYDYSAVEKANASTVDGNALAYLYAAHNDHSWYGLRSTYRTMLGNYIDLSAGIDLRYYIGTHYDQVTDLLGANYFYQPYVAGNTPAGGSVSADINDPNKRAVVGDKIDYYNKDIVESGGAFAQAEYSKDNWTAFVTLTGNASADQRNDYFNYLNSDPAQKSPFVKFLTYQAKAGAQYDINDQMNVFANIGYLTKPPYFDNAFENYTNKVDPHTVDEKLFSYELGYGYKLPGFSAKLNLYRTSYMDEAFNEAIPHGTTDLYTVDVSGVNELHQGAELELKLQPIRDITINGMFSYGDWYYTSNAGPATEYNAQQQVVGSIDHVDLKGIKTGDAAQTTAHLGIDVKVLPQIKIGADYFYWGNYTSRFDFTQADSPDLHPWKVPNVSIWNLDAIFSFKIANYDAQLVGNIQNLLNTKYISDSYDAALSGNPNNVSVFYAAGRTFTTSLKIKF